MATGSSNGGFFSLGPCYNSSEPDVETSRHFIPLSLAQNELVRALPKTGSFSFSQIPSKRAAKLTGELEDILFSDIPISLDDSDLYIHDLSDQLLIKPIPESLIPNCTNHFPGESPFCNSKQYHNTSLSNAIDQPSPTRNFLLDVKELANKNCSGRLKIKILDNVSKSKILTPKASKKIAAKAHCSELRAREEKGVYDDFLKKLKADESVSSEDDEPYDLSNEDGEDVFWDNKFLEPKHIPSKELQDLFEEFNNTKMVDLALCSDLIDRHRPIKIDSGYMKRLHRHINMHFQLLVQNLALSGEIINADQIWMLTLKMMIRTKELYHHIHEHRKPAIHGEEGLEILLRILGQSPPHEELLKQFKDDNFDKNLRLKASVSCIKFITKLSDGRYPVFSKSFWHILSIFGESYDPNYSLIKRGNGKMARALVGQLYIGRTDLLDHQIIKDKVSCRRFDSFLGVEDKLLLLGLNRYGLGNWEKIQSRFIPTRSAKQLYVRFKNLTCRRAPINPIKEFVNEAMKPLSKVEEELLLQGIKSYKTDWVIISSRFLPHRPASVLQRWWHNLQSNNISVYSHLEGLKLQKPTDL